MTGPGTAEYPLGRLNLEHLPNGRLHVVLVDPTGRAWLCGSVPVAWALDTQRPGYELSVILTAGARCHHRPAALPAPPPEEP